MIDYKSPGNRTAKSPHEHKMFVQAKKGRRRRAGGRCFLTNPGVVRGLVKNKTTMVHKDPRKNPSFSLSLKEKK
jgi:hypothetical protein